MPSKRKTISEADNVPPASPTNSNATSSAPVKRQRVSRACDQCRAAREKCDGKQPMCFPCVFQNRACTYQTNPKKRGVQTGYIKTLEVALAWLFDKVPGTEDALENLLTHDGGQGQSLLVGKESEKSNRLHKRWRKSKVQKEIDRILSGGQASQARADKSSPSDNDESDAAHSDKAATTKIQDPTPSEGPAPLKNRSSSSILDGHQGSSAVFKTIKLPHGHWRLLDIYFSYTHCWFPILERQGLLKTVYLYPGEGLDILHTRTASASHAELWAALALASYQDASSSKPTVQDVSADASLSPDETYDIARRLIPSEEGEFEIQHARALLLLALINIGKGKKTSAWILVGIAHRISLDISELPRDDELASRRATSVLMGCCILDTIISVHRRGLAGLEKSTIIEGMSIPEDNLDEWQHWAPCDGFGQNLPGPAVSSRSPAYSLTTFNQLYDIFEFLRKHSSEKQNGTLLTEHPADVMVLLNQTIKPRLPFGDFVTDRASSSATIPSAYILRILFLWVSTLLESTRESPCVLILESVEQYLTQFGACGAPPFFASCLAMMTQHRSFGDLHPHSRDRWHSITEVLASIWISPRSRPTNTVHMASAELGPSRSSDPSMASSIMRISTSISTTTPPNFYPTNGLRTPTLPAKTYPSNSAPFMISTFSPPKPVHNQRVGPAPATTSIEMMQRHSMHGGPGPPLGQPQHQAVVPGAGIVYSESANGAPLDYDALLDDLSMDYIDRVDTDPQFMANLGFAPGADITEILSREFGAI
ncbi:Quinic acid utilization activator [Cytospora mali]|uniref:Quinic acid utilization activator n=1 Tax=Cytospora mali TaxID=578113 RepID=A0A194V6R0_CYTMA|nr:Quinic acid utilization activator [Valsa mali var. pyri (nom. inval.)]